MSDQPHLFDVPVTPAPREPTMLARLRTACDRPARWVIRRADGAGVEAVYCADDGRQVRAFVRPHPAHGWRITTDRGGDARGPVQAEDVWPWLTDWSRRVNR
jgi:hypothetical protein